MWYNITVQGTKVYKYRAYGNNATITSANHWLDLCRNLYNCALEERITAYKSSRKSVSFYSQCKELFQIKQGFPQYKTVDAQCLEYVLKRLDRAYESFFRRVKNGEIPGFPRFQGRDRFDSFTLRQTGWKLDGKYLTIRNIGRFKLKLSRPIQGTIKEIVIRRDNLKWYVSFVCVNVPCNVLRKSDKEIGIDIGLESFLTMSDGSQVANPRFFKHNEDVLAMRNRRVSRRVKGSNRRRKAKVLVGKAHTKVKNQRHDFHYKLVNLLLKQYGIIYIEKLHSWKTWRTLNKSMRDVAWFEFFNILKVKAEEAGRRVVEVPAKGTSQRCSRCGTIVPKDLSIRVHNCPVCGLNIHRDHNSALEILRLGQSLQAKSPAPSLS